MADSSVHAPPIRTIHIGVGGRGRWPIGLLFADEHFQPVALVDTVPEHLQWAAAQCGLPLSATFTDAAAAVATVEADALVICTPTATHARFCRLGFAAHKHVLVEKGMTLDWEEARSLVAEAGQAGIAFCVAQNYRYGSESQTLKNLLTSDAYGCPHLIDYIHHRYRPEPRTLDYRNAMIWDMSCHHFDNLVYWFGAVQRVTAVTYSAPWSRYPYDAGVSAVLEFASGPVCTYELTHQATFNDYRLVLQTERGALRIQSGRWEFLPALGGAPFGVNGPVEPVEMVMTTRTEQGVIGDWYRYITTRQEPGISGRNNLETLAICELTCRAAARRTTVERDDLNV
ncbi:MAG: Gfo/Idh/MocA family oxidoreductase [Chloroflexi bacterium]|nr:Gfo/Idh/MocA family oxidoreductase [Chloroflexota bacterium]